MIKKFVTILSISILCFTSIGFESYAEGKYTRTLIKGNTRQVSMKLNESAFKKADEAILINEDAIIDGISVTPLAYAKNAPIIPVKWKDIDKSTEDYLDKIGVKKITIIGSLQSVSQTSENHLKQLGYEVDRIYGDTRYDTSMKIATELNDIKEVNNILLIHANAGLENPLSIYSYAAQNNTPIIWSDGENFEEVKSYISKNKIEKVYAIRYTERFSYNLKENIENVQIIEEINKAQGNIKFIKYLQKNLTNKVYAINVEYGNRSNINEYISLGVVAAKQNIPIFICEERLTKPQENYLDKNNIDYLEQIGTKINDYSIYETLTSKSFLYSIILIIILIIMSIRVFINKA
ncbi:cell wall-binding repeat-containing protein [Romboutsia ilealis]|uniref:cell wall-binding repeat-containing protein n=1 Tax=Romboutsia ilealis TaxID=1115758 RepID=UPI002573F31F|nr:cell wall-binding repeat-containing protein [Romboutsia ilealis]